MLALVTPVWSIVRGRAFAGRLRSGASRGAGWLGLAVAFCANCPRGALRAEDPLAPPAAAHALTTIEQVVKLRAADFTAGPIEARVQGVVIYVSPPTRRLYVQAGEFCVQANLAGPITEFSDGHFVEIAGSVENTLPMPRLINVSARVLGSAPLPEAVASSPQRFAVGKDFLRLVKVRGVVRDMTLENGSLMQSLTTEGLAFEYGIPSGPAHLPRGWLEAEIEATGFALPFYTASGTLTGFRFHSPTTNYLRVLRPGNFSLFDRPLLTIAEASRLAKQWQPRCKIAGTVTLHRGNDLYLEDGTGAMHVSLFTLLPKPGKGESLPHDRQTLLRPGDRVEVIGVRQNSYALAPMLLHAEYRLLGTAPSVDPVPVSGSDLRAGRQAGRLVSVEAKLLNQRTWSERIVHRHLMMLQAGDEVFQATWSGELTVDWNFEVDSFYRVTAVNDAESGELKDRITFQLQLRGPEDVQAMPTPPFWRRPGLRKPLLVGFSVAGVAAAWILMQRRLVRRLRRLNEEWEQRVHERTAELQVALAAEKELNQLKGSFISMVSHEFRTPLGVILSSSNILDRYLDRLPPEKRAAQLRAIRKSIHRMNDLIDDVLLLGKFDAGALNCQPETVDLVTFCLRLAKEVESAAARDGAIQFSAAPLNGEAVADEGLLQHILTNILGNAVKYSAPDQPVEFTLTRCGINAEFVIRDHGCGIPAADQARLFTAFYRGGNVGQQPGSGLGLVIAKRCVDLHGGTIRCESQEDQGTTFFVNLPLFDGTRFFRRRAADTAAASRNP